MSEDEHMEEDLKNAMKFLEKVSKKFPIFEYPKWKYEILMEELKKSERKNNDGEV